MTWLTNDALLCKHKLLITIKELISAIMMALATQITSINHQVKNPEYINKCCHI